MLATLSGRISRRSAPSVQRNRTRRSSVNNRRALVPRTDMVDCQLNRRPVSNRNPVPGQRSIRSFGQYFTVAIVVGRSRPVSVSRLFELSTGDSAGSSQAQGYSSHARHQCIVRQKYNHYFRIIPMHRRRRFRHDSNLTTEWTIRITKIGK